MTRPKKSTAEMQSIRENILDVALEILQKDGPEAISSRAIAERLGVAHMSLFTYFKNQAGILAALREREMSKWRTRQNEIEKHLNDSPPPEVVSEILQMLAGFARENPNLFRLAWVVPEMTGESPQESRQRTRNTVDSLAGLLKSGMEQGYFKKRDPFLAASVVLGMVNMPHILFHSGKISEAALRDRMVDEMLVAAFSYLQTPGK